jgi:hypothetical protein
MTTLTQDTTPRRGSIDPAGQQPARRAACRDDERYGTRAAEAHGMPRWNPDDGDYS